MSDIIKKCIAPCYDYILAQQPGHFTFVCLWMPSVNTFPNFAFLFFPMAHLIGTFSLTVTGNINYKALSKIWHISGLCSGHS